MLRWRLLFSRMREQPPGQGLCSCHLLLPVVRAKNAVCMRLAYASCPWNLEQKLNLSELLLWGQRVMSGQLERLYSLVMILHSSAGLLSKTTATRIWVANAGMKTWGNSTRRYASQDHQRSPLALKGTDGDYRYQRKPPFSITKPSWSK